MELIVSITIIGILVGIAVPIYINQIKQAIETEVKSDVSSTAMAISAQTQNKPAFTYNPCASAEWTKVKVQTSPENIIKCSYYGETRTVTQDEKKQAYKDYEWCISGTRPTDIQGSWNWNSRTKKMTEGSCAEVGAPDRVETIG